MAKQSLVQRQKKRQRVVRHFRQRRADLKERIRTAPTLTERFALQGELQKLPRNSSATRLNNRCLLTGRSRAYYRHFGLTRHQLRQKAHLGELPGVTKASW
jgi:small subunit ribosomal protein S14